MTCNTHTYSILDVLDPNNQQEMFWLTYQPFMKLESRGRIWELKQNNDCSATLSSFTGRVSNILLLDTNNFRTVFAHQYSLWPRLHSMLVPCWQLLAFNATCGRFNVFKEGP